MFLGLSSEIFSWIRGAILILFIYHMVTYFLNRKRHYLFYSLYLLSFFLFFLKDTLPTTNQSIYRYINFSIQFLGYAAYIAFARNLLNTKKYIPEWDKLLILQIKVFFAIAAVFIYTQIGLGYGYQQKLLIVVAPIATVFTILTYIVLTKIKGKVTIFFIIGSFTHLLLANISIVGPFALGSEFFTSRGVEPMFFTYLGVIIETTMFAMIIAYKNRMFEKERDEIQEVLAVKTKQMSDLKMTVLQTKMDPHFLYNSLNSINNFVLQNNPEKASDYITKFSRLIREVLRNSSRLTIPLSDDLHTLGLYVKLEQMRMIGGLNYIVTIDDTIDLNKIQVPPLFMQPYIENAIWHGFINKKSNKEINLIISDEDDYVKCEILDNGIGIDRSKSIVKKTGKSNTSFGLKASEDRIKLLYENKNVYVIIKDISEGTATGTKVTIKFPKKL